MNLQSKYSEILKLKTNSSIADEIASRQLKVIEKAYDFLASDNNNIIYIADEVGLGKTYIGLGIISLFRYFSKNVQDHRDLIIVPKKNLQQKWQKEIKNFISNNLLLDSPLTHNLKDQNFIKDKLGCINENDSISIFRMTSFSSLSSARKNEFFIYLTEELFEGDDFTKIILSEAKNKGFFNKGFESDLRKLVAYLLNVKSAKVDCLIIDESHNYKHGIGSDDFDASIRNEVTARFLGALKDDRILKQFPSLSKKVKFPLAAKIICLSATPKDRCLLEIKRQFSCFTNKHALSNANTTKDVEQKLKSFLIRGNMEYNIADQAISRNQCRFEHRHGNVNKAVIAEPLVIEDNFESIFWQLLQYKSIKHLNLKHNASFEIGMLAGFESYKIDADKAIKVEVQDENGEEIIPDKEYEYTSHRNIKESHDADLIRKIFDSYKNSFEDIPPHPKQSKLEDEIIKQLKNQEKSLIFVRRVATTFELEQRLTHRFEKEVVFDLYLKLDGKYAKYNSLPVLKLKNAYKDRYFREKLPDCFSALLKNKEFKEFFKSNGTTYNQNLDWLIFTFDALESESVLKQLLIKFIGNKKRKPTPEFKETLIKALKENHSDWQKEVQDDTDKEAVDEDQTGYFFLNYFKKGQSGFSFRKKLYRENWFELNLHLINNHFKVIQFNEDELFSLVEKIVPKDKTTNYQAFDLFQNAFKQFIQEKPNLDMLPHPWKSDSVLKLSESTFLTDLLLLECRPELDQWILNRLSYKEVSSFIQDFELLNSLIRSVFRNGSGLLPAFVADAADEDFNTALKALITNKDSPFNFVHQEIKTIIRDYDLLVSTNFQERDEKKASTALRSLIPILGISGQAKRDRSMVATQFRTPGYPYVLVTTDIFKEGEDLHTYCQNIYHYGIAWNPSDMEQRTGRIDRINSLSYRKLNENKVVNFDNKIQVFYPFLSQSVEVNQVVRLLENINKFLRTFNDIETEMHYESKVEIDKMLTDLDIPEAITERLISKYDVMHFEV